MDEVKILATFDHYFLCKVQWTSKDNSKEVNKKVNTCYICFPANYHEKYQLVIDFPEEYYKSLRDEEMIHEIKNICDKIYSNNNNYVYILTNVTTYDLAEAENDNDSPLYNHIFKKIGICISMMLKQYHSILVDETIYVNVQTNDDEKLIQWLEIHAPMYQRLNIDSSLNKEINNDDTGWTTMGGIVNGGVSIEASNSVNKPKAKKLALPNKHGFLNITFIITIILISIVIGVGLAYIIMK